MESLIYEIASSKQVDHCLSTLHKHVGNIIFQQNINSIIQIINHLYYNEGTSPWDDATYDEFITILKDKYKLDYTKNVGSEIKDGETVALPYFLASMTKHKTWKEIHHWMKTYKAPYSISAKLDGISALYCNNKLYTRGNGKIGRDISYLLPYLNLPSLTHLSFRGELIMKKSVFYEKHADQFSNPRNLVCGIMNRNIDLKNEDIYKDVDFIVYDIYSTMEMNFKDKIQYLKKYKNVNIVEHVHDVSELSIELCDKQLALWKNTHDYEIDGIIITSQENQIHPSSGNPKFAFAYKNNDLCVDMKEGIVKQVLWNLSKDNYLKPKIQLEHPILCDHSKIEFVTGFNAKYILTNKIVPGTKLLIGLSGNVIPHIFKVFPNEIPCDDCLPKLEENYVWSKNKVDLICLQKDNPTSIIKRNMVFFKTMECKCNLQEATLMNVYKSLGLYKLEDILTLSEEQWVSVEKVGQKKAQIICQHIYEKLNYDANCDVDLYDILIQYMVGSQVFERGFAKKKIQLYMNYVYELEKTNSFSVHSFYDIDYFKSKISFILSSVQESDTKQITYDTMELFLKGFECFISFMENLHQKVTTMNIPTLELLLKTKISNEKKVSTEKKYVLFSGFRDKNLELKLMKNGYSIGDTINKNITLLVVKDKTKTSVKMKKANELNIPIYDANELKELFK